MLKKLCADTGTVPPPVVSSGNAMLLHFVSDGSVQKGGFSATYTTPSLGLFVMLLLLKGIQNPYLSGLNVT